ncbi:glycoside hydrolase family protein [Nostoc sp. 2RC]|uniref:glycoside hydrolase family protein n=1 Tax=Nostoc sp. 2RC TaxID=2485484 RepID=UPI001623838A|nr:glycoside hydrolase family protein [Nostoc sp. 2RC]MBC1238367.1 glycoside hydrolase family protein [Nostoc sp. 2RC]
MKPSNDCLSLIKKWEGLHRKRPDGLIEAYKDPVGIWTIGYGSIEHLDLDRPIQQGDVISQTTAERWLKLEVEEAAEDVDRLCQSALTQSMFDALVSFVYNIGIGAFSESTLLRKLNNDVDYEGAAGEFDRWVNGTDNGTRRILPGLVNRRNDEEALFRRDGLNPSVGGSGSSTSGSITTPTTSSVEEYPYKPAPVPLPFTRALLVKGDVGDDSYILNCALAGLGFLRMAPQPNEFSDITKSAVELLQRREALSKIDGKVGPETKRAMENALKRARGLVPPVTPERGVYCRLTRTRKDAYQGLEWCKLEFVDPTGGVVESLKVVSGAPGAQRFLLFSDPDSLPRSLQPIPQGRYTIGDISWARGKDNYNASHPHPNNGIGPVWVPFVGKQSDDRGDFGFHVDWNWIQEGNNPGSAGCVCPTSLEDLKELVRLLGEFHPRLLVVDWGL